LAICDTGRFVLGTQARLAKWENQVIANLNFNQAKTSVIPKNYADPGAPTAHVPVESPKFPQDLVQVIKCWLDLPTHIKVAIMAMIRVERD